MCVCARVCVRARVCVCVNVGVGGRGGGGGGFCGGGCCDGCCGGCGRAFEFANVIISSIFPTAAPVIHLITCVAQTTHFTIDIESVTCICPIIQVTFIRVPFEFIDTSSIVTFFIVRIY